MKTWFVSSTFRDMHDERDYLHKIIIPDLSREAFEYGETIAIRDLRWGVNTGNAEDEAEANKIVLSACFDAIDACECNMIVFLGNRYGFKPGRNVIREVLNDKHTGFSLSDEDADMISVTELEIRYALRNINSEAAPKIIFYIRHFKNDGDENIPQQFLPDLNDRQGEEKLSRLKEYIKNLDSKKKNVIVRNYEVKWNPEKRELDGMRELAVMIENDVRQLMREEWEELSKLTDSQKERNKHKEFARIKNIQYWKRTTLTNKVKDLLEKGNNCLAVQGEAGTGKTAFMSRLSAEFSNDTTEVLSLFCGYTPLTCNALDLMKRMIEFLEESFEAGDLEYRKMKPSGADWEKWRGYLESCVDRFQMEKKGKKLLILVDAVDQLSASEVRDNLLFIPRNLSSQVQMVISCIKSFPIPFLQKDIVEIRCLESDDDKEHILKNMFGALGKKAYQGVLDKIKKKSSADNPLYLSLLVQRLAMLEKEDFQHIEVGNDYDHDFVNYQNALLDICPDDPGEMCVNILREASRRMGREIPELVVQYLAVSRYGLRETDLENILGKTKWSSLEFFRLYKYMSSLFIIREDGRYDFSHRSIREGYRKWCISPKNDKRDGKQTEGSYKNITELHRKILSHLKELEYYDPVRMSEIVYHCFHADDREYLVEYICGKEGQRKLLDDAGQKMVLESAARGVYEICAEAEGWEWLCRVLSDCDPWDRGEETVDILKFIYHFLHPLFESSVEQLKIQKKIYASCFGLANDLYQWMKNKESLGLLADACYYLGNVCHRLGGTENDSRALNLYLREQRAANELSEQFAAEELYLRRKDSLQHLGDIYASVGGRENRNRALRLYIRCMEMSEQFAISDDSGVQEHIQLQKQECYQKLGSIYALGSWEDQKKAHVLYNKAICLLMNRDVKGREPEQIICDSALSSVKKAELMRILVHDGDVLMHLHGKKDKEAALKLFSCAESIARERKDQPLLKKNRLEWLIYLDRREFVRGLLNKESLEKLKNQYRDSYDILSWLEKGERGSIHIRRVHAAFLEHEGSLILNNAMPGMPDHEIYMISENEMLQNIAQLNSSVLEAEEKFKEAESIMREICDTRKDAGYQRDLFVILCKLGDICVWKNKNVHSKEASEAFPYYHEAYENYHEACEMAEALRKMYGMPQNRADLIVIKTKLGDLYSSAETAEERRRAEVYYMQALEEAISLEKELHTPESVMNVAVLCGKAAKISSDERIKKSMESRKSKLTEYARGLTEDETFRDSSFKLHCNFTVNLHAC